MCFDEANEKLVIIEIVECACKYVNGISQNLQNVNPY